MVPHVRPEEAWHELESNARAHLVDVRTDTEWARIGVPDLSGLGKQPALISWQVAPAMQLNPAFLDELRAAGFGAEDHLYFLCRSGVRSLHAAEAAIAAGFPHSYNVADGFEGPPDMLGRRGKQAGWQADGLPWRQG